MRRWAPVLIAAAVMGVGLSPAPSVASVPTWSYDTSTSYLVPASGPSARDSWQTSSASIKAPVSTTAADPAPTPTAPDPQPAPTPISTPVPVTLEAVCQITFMNPEVGLAVIVHDTSDGTLNNPVSGASVTAQLVGTAQQYAAAPATVLSGTTTAPAPPWMGGGSTPMFAATEPFSVPPVLADANGNQLPSAYTTYRCHGSATWQGQTISF